MKPIIFTLIAFVLLKSNYSNGQSGARLSIYFSKGSWEIDKKYDSILEQLATQCLSDSFAWIKMLGYADSSGTDDYNDSLSRKRVDEVYNRLLLYAPLNTALIYRDALGRGGDLYDLHFPSAHLHERCVDIRAWFNKPKKAKQ